MTLLFDVENPASGFRLLYLDLFNWGTFDRKIWRITPNGSSSLLTGGNGSGKTTLADAVVTLLVPPAKRFYNQSSGSDRKRDRNETTYVMGAYKTIKEESHYSARTQHLRTRDDFSILLGVFHNKDANETVTLAQVRWFGGNILRRVFIVSLEALGIREHFYPIDTGGKWKTRLKEDHQAEFYDSFVQYSRKFSRIFGLRSDKALSLFSQTVGIKDIENLNGFIRNHMLEETAIEDHFMKLRENYENLLISHTAIEKARVQLELLSPIAENSREYSRTADRLAQLEAFRQEVPGHFCQKENRLLDAAIREAETKRERLDRELLQERAGLTELEAEKDGLLSAIGGNEAASQLKQMDIRLSALKRERDRRRQQALRYDDLAASLGLARSPDREQFSANSEAAGQRLDVCRSGRKKLQEADNVAYASLSEANTAFTVLADELKILREKKTNIPPVFQRARQQVAGHLGIDVSELPFAGELISVKPSESRWEECIEAVLRDFALTLLVPESKIREVSEFVNAGFDGVVRYVQTARSTAPALFESSDPMDLMAKIEVKPDHPVSGWLENYLSARFQHALQDDLETFLRFDQAGTENALVKDRISFRRDARPEATGRGAWVLGWDNTEKIAWFQAKAKRLDAQIKEIERARAADAGRLRRLETETVDLERFRGFADFDEIDVSGLTRDIQDLMDQRERLLAESDKLRELERQLTDVKARISEQRGRETRLIETLALVGESLRQYTARKSANTETIRQHPAPVSPDVAEGLAAFLDHGEPLSLESIGRLREAAVTRLDGGIREASNACHQLRTVLVRAMQQFKNPDEEIRQRFQDWSALTANLKADPDYIRDFLAIHDRIRRDDLPAHQARFKKYLNEQVIFDIANFKTTLDDQLAGIRENIRQINRTLTEIDYSSHPPTFIELTESPVRDERISRFNEMLKAAIPDAVKIQRGDEMELEHAFIKIRDVIETLSENPDARKFVTDVRNWLRFSAIERYRADNGQAHYYEDSQSLSGGEKAKLAYTILASALAYQFGISRTEFHYRSFRFVIVDEAFSKVDPENSIYAMELFRKLNLQVMLITPLDRINLAEPYISAVHYVENPKQRESRVYDITWEEYERLKHDHASPDPG